MVEDRVRKACSVIESEDVELSNKIIKSDWEIDEMEIEIEEECLKIMALYQPVAKDLRFLVTVIKINNEMERIGDYAVQIAKRMKRLSKFGSPAFSYNFQEMTDKVMRELRMSIDALVDRDVEIAKQIFSLDQEINDLRSQLDTALTRQFDKELGDSVQRIREAVAPYTRFVRVEREKLERLSSELKAADVEVSTLRTLIEDLSQEPEPVPEPEQQP